MKKQRRRDGGFTLVELLIAMAVVLVLIAGIAIAGERSLEAGRETSAAQSVQSFAANETTYQRSYGGFSLLAANLGGAGSSLTATCDVGDQEMITTATLPGAYDTGIVQSGYTLKYAANSGAGFAGSGGCGQHVAPSYDFTATSVDGKTKNFCADNTGAFYLPAGSTVATTGKGCIAENSGAIPIGQ